MRVGLATIHRGRHAHVARQIEGVLHQTRRPDDHLVVSMDPSGTPEPSWAGSSRTPGTGSSGAVPRVLRLPVPDGQDLPFAAARNAAVAALGAMDLVVLLDADCVPGPELVARYASAAQERYGLLAGPVGHLPPGRPSGTTLSEADRRSAGVRGGRPVPGDDQLLDEPRYERFWSLSFAVAPAVHERTGGFDEGYVGYGGEDTDYAFRARRACVPLTWVGGAWAYHQHHPVSDPPLEHLDAIVANARRFRAAWGRWPMEGWLSAFAERGLVDWTPDGHRLNLRSRG